MEPAIQLSVCKHSPHSPITCAPPWGMGAGDRGRDSQKAEAWRPFALRKAALAPPEEGGGRTVVTAFAEELGQTLPTAPPALMFKLLRPQILFSRSENFWGDLGESHLVRSHPWGPTSRIHRTAFWGSECSGGGSHGLRAGEQNLCTTLGHALLSVCSSA